MSYVLKIGTRIGYVNGGIINLGTIESREETSTGLPGMTGWTMMPRSVGQNCFPLPDYCIGFDRYDHKSGGIRALRPQGRTEQSWTACLHGVRKRYVPGDIAVYRK